VDDYTDIETVAERFTTKNPYITRVIIGNRGPSGIIIAKRIYFEIHFEDKKIIAIDWISALATVHELELEAESG
jgi:hypothetical protein